MKDRKQNLPRRTLARIDAPPSTSLLVSEAIKSRAYRAESGAVLVRICEIIYEYTVHC